MSDTTTPTIRFTLPPIGGDIDTWGAKYNSNWSYADEAQNALVTVNVPNANVVLVADGTINDQARYAIYNFTGALTADRRVTIPANGKLGWAINSTTGGHNIILANPSGTVLLLPASGAWQQFWASGAAVVQPPVYVHVTPAVNAINSSNNCAIDFSGLGMTLHMAPAGSAIFDYVASLSTFAWGFGTTTPMSLNGNTGNLAITGILSQASDRRVKSSIEYIPTDTGLLWLDAVMPVSYEIGGQPSAGFIAQELVHAGFTRGLRLHPNPDLVEEPGSPAGQQYVLDLESQVAYLTAAVQGLARRLKALEHGYVRS